MKHGAGCVSTFGIWDAGSPQRNLMVREEGLPRRSDARDTNSEKELAMKRRGSMSGQLV